MVKSLFRNATCEAVLARLISDTTGWRVTRQQATHTPANALQRKQQRIIIITPHPFHPATGTGHETSDSGWPWCITQNGSISSLTRRPSLTSCFCIFSSSTCCFHPLPAFPPIRISSLLSRPRPQTALQLVAHSQSPLSAHFPRRHTILLCCLRIHRVSLAVGRSCCLACVLPLPCSPRRSRVKAARRSLSVCQQRHALDGTD